MCASRCFITNYQDRLHIQRDRWFIILGALTSNLGVLTQRLVTATIMKNVYSAYGHEYDTELTCSGLKRVLIQRMDTVKMLITLRFKEDAYSAHGHGQ
ncbi:hypothetical protein J6590_091716, partial [Homalodisca vitripennis]